MAAAGESYLVVAIDFGTTYTGFAYGRGANLEDIKLNKTWDSNVGLSAYKTATSVLVSQHGDLEEFGFNAEYKYSNLCANKDGDSIELYKHFKMLLYDTKDISRTTEIKSVRGIAKPALDVFALALNEIKRIFLETIEKIEGREPNESEIKWVITIPAIWSDKAKFFMRRAAFQAGLILDVYSNKLLFALEPEAASLYIHALNTDQFKTLADDGHRHVELHPGTKYMVVDAGGGTVDITAHEVLGEGHLKELVRASGGNWGSLNVNLRFYEWMETVFGKEFISAYKAESPHKWLEEFEIMFEKKKRSNRPDGNAMLTLPITRYFDKKYEEITGTTVDDLIVKYSGGGISLQDDAISINIGGILDLYHDDFSRITKHLEELLERPQLQGLKYIFLIGGFAEDEFLQKAVTGLFSEYVVLTPEFSSTAVMRGAVIFGHNSARIISRIASKSYGYEVRIPFKEGQHDPKKKVLDEFQKEYCKDVFDKIVSVGEEVLNHEERKFSVKPFLSTATKVAIRFYCTEKPGIKYVDEPEVEKLYEADLKMEDTTGGKDRKIEIKVKFGGTELFVEAWDPREGGHKLETTIDFLCN